MMNHGDTGLYTGKERTLEITLEQFKQYIPDVTLDDTRIELYLSDARRAVERDGFGVEHKDFDELQKFYALALMQDDKVSGVKSATASGNNPEGISSIGVAGISIGFSNPSSGGSGTAFTRSGKIGYYVDYENLVKKIRGFKGKLV
jgi:hypothetical protein